MPMFMDPTYDFIFKRLFGEIDHINLTKSLVNALCRFTGDDEVEIATFLNREQIPGGAELQEARTFVDIYCETKGKMNSRMECNTPRLTRENLVRS